MLELIVLQLVLPLGLLAWLIFRPARNWAALSAQFAGTAAILLALHLSGLWMFPPWWSVWIYWALFVVAALGALRRRPVFALPAGLFGWGALLLLTAVALYGGWASARAWQGRQTPDEPAVNLHFPLAGGRYLVVNGGTNTQVSSHALTFHPETARQRLYSGQSHGVDIVALDGFGLTADGLSPADPRRYVIFGHPVSAPCAGLVVQSANDKPDMLVPIMDKQNMVGNHLLLRRGAVDILLAHFRQGSVRVNPGQRVSLGDILGEAGNSGNTSAPHLHIHAQQAAPPDVPFSGRPIPMQFNGRYLVRGDRI